MSLYRNYSIFPAFSLVSDEEKIMVYFSGKSKDKESSEEKAKKKEANQRKNMAKGVGYSSYQQKGWDVKAYMAAQKEKDKQIELVLAKIHLELKKLHSHSVAARNLPDLVDGAISGRDDSDIERNINKFIYTLFSRTSKQEVSTCLTKVLI